MPLIDDFFAEYHFARKLDDPKCIVPFCTHKANGPLCAFCLRIGILSLGVPDKELAKLAAILLSESKDENEKLLELQRVDEIITELDEKSEIVKAYKNRQKDKLKEFLKNYEEEEPLNPKPVLTERQKLLLSRRY